MLVETIEGTTPTFRQRGARLSEHQHNFSNTEIRSYIIFYHQNIYHNKGCVLCLSPCPHVSFLCQVPGPGRGESYGSVAFGAVMEALVSTSLEA